MFTSSSSHSQTFDPTRRLHYPWEYRRFFNQSYVFRLSECVIFRIPNDLNHYRVGITLKSRGSSVERNRVKRQIREFFRTHPENLGSFDYNVVVPNSKKMTYIYAQRLRECLQGQFVYAISKKPGKV